MAPPPCHLLSLHNPSCLSTGEQDLPSSTCHVPSLSLHAHTPCAPFSLSFLPHPPFTYTPTTCPTHQTFPTCLPLETDRREWVGWMLPLTASCCAAFCLLALACMAPWPAAHSCLSLLPSLAQAARTGRRGRYIARHRRVVCSRMVHDLATC